MYPEFVKRDGRDFLLRERHFFLPLKWSPRAYFHKKWAFFFFYTYSIFSERFKISIKILHRMCEMLTDI